MSELQRFFVRWLTEHPDLSRLHHEQVLYSEHYHAAIAGLWRIH